MYRTASMTFFLLILRLFFLFFKFLSKNGYNIRILLLKKSMESLTEWYFLKYPCTNIEPWQSRIQNLESKFQRQSSGATRILSSRQKERREQAKSCQKHVRANSTMISRSNHPKAERENVRGREATCERVKVQGQTAHRSWYGKDSRRRATMRSGNTGVEKEENK